MESANIETTRRQKFTIVELENSKIEIIKTSWAFFNEQGEICSATIPDISKKEIEKLLMEEDNDNTWYETAGNTHKVIKTYSYSGE